MIITPIWGCMLAALLLGGLALYIRKVKQIKVLEGKAAELESILVAIPDAIVFTDIDRNIVSINKGVELLYDYSINDLAGKSTSIFYENNEDYEQQGRVRFNIGADGIDEFQSREINYQRKDGSVFLGETLSRTVKSASGQFLGFVTVSKDISERKKVEEKLVLAASVFINVREAIMISDKNASIIDVNDSFTEILGYSREEVIGEDPKFFRSDKHSAEFYAERRQIILATGHWDGEQWIRRKDGEDIAIRHNVDAVYDQNGDVKNYVTTFSDITTMKEDQEQLKRSAHYDPLTRLPNRILLVDRLNHAMMQRGKNQSSLAVVFMDLDGFKAVNDTFGHSAGDDLLAILARHMKGALREGDILARFGGDEFVAILTGVSKVEDCEPVLKRLLKATATPVTLGDAVMRVSASIGITLYPQDDADAEQLIRHADQAMYIAKQGGKGRYHFFDTAQDKASTVQRESFGDIRSALKRNEFLLYYQPKVNMESGNVIGVEALIRWHHSSRGLVPPLDFLPAIEGHAISLEIGEWVIEAALAQISQWQGVGIQLPVSVNISAYQIQQDNFVARLGVFLAAHPEVNPCFLELEILETSALSDIGKVADTMRACLDLGVRFALDDFGTGYSSLTYLRRLPASLIKIDQSFVRDMLVDTEDFAIVEGIIALTKSFKLDVIAEGVETIEHGAVLLELGCELAQGYGIARPMPASDVPAWISDWKPDASWQA